MPVVFACLFIFGLAFPSCPSWAATPRDIGRAVRDIFHPPDQPLHRALSPVAQSLEHLFSLNLANATPRSSTIVDCAQMLLDNPGALAGSGLSQDQVETTLADHQAKEFFADTLTTDFTALAFWLDKMPPAKRAVLYYVLGIRYLALQSTVLKNESSQSSLANGAEVYLVCARQHDAQVSSYANSELFDEPPKLAKPEVVVRKLRQILAATGIADDALEQGASLLPSLAFTGGPSKVETRRQSRLLLYYWLFHERVDPLAPEILEAIYQSERLLGFKDPFRK